MVCFAFSCSSSRCFSLYPCFWLRHTLRCVLPCVHLSSGCKTLHLWHFVPQTFSPKCLLGVFLWTGLGVLGCMLPCLFLCWCSAFVLYLWCFSVGEIVGLFLLSLFTFFIIFSFFLSLLVSFFLHPMCSLRRVASLCSFLIGEVHMMLKIWVKL